MPAELPPRRTAEQIEQLVRDLEGCTLAPAEFNHHAHMTVAIWYLAHMPLEPATAAMRAAIKRFAAHHGHQQLYHETITRFWMRLLDHYLQSAAPGAPLADLTERAIAELGSIQPLFRHYSRALVLSEQARREWIEPDLSPLPASPAAHAP